MKNKKKSLVTVLICIAVLAAAAAGIWFLWLKDYLSAAGATPVYVNPVSSIIGLDTGSNAKYSGIVEPQETYKITKDESKTVAEVVVKEGDEVHFGDVLFRYDTQEIQWALDQAQIDQERIASELTTLRSQLTELNAAKKKAAQDEQAAYTLQINTKQLEIKTQEYESSLKKSEIDKLKTSLNSAEVLAEVEGIVKEVNANSQQDMSGQSKPFISILSNGEYRVKGTVSELNFSSISEGQAVVVHSRVNPEQTWKGVIDSIDREASTDQDNMMYYYGGMDTGEKSSKYNFYVILDDPTDLILGQHVYIEPDLGENVRKEGIWLPAMYIDRDEDGSFVWAKNDKDKLEKRDILLGEYDKDNDTYQIKSGITRADSIAYPSDTLKPGMPITMDASLQGAYMDSPDGMTDNYMTPDDSAAIPAGGDAVIPEGDMAGDNGYLDGEVYPGNDDGSLYNDGYSEDYGEDSGGEGVVE